MHGMHFLSIITNLFVKSLLRISLMAFVFSQFFITYAYVPIIPLQDMFKT